MDFYYQAIGILIIGALSAFLLKELGSRAAPAVGVIVSLSVIGGAFGKIDEIASLFSSIGEHNEKPDREVSLGKELADY